MDELLEALSKAIGDGDVMAKLAAAHDAMIVHALHEGTMDKLADYEKKTGKKLDQNERERFIVTCVYMNMAHNPLFNGDEDDDDDDDSDKPGSVDSFDENEKPTHDNSDAAAALAALLGGRR